MSRADADALVAAVLFVAVGAVAAWSILLPMLWGLFRRRRSSTGSHRGHPVVIVHRPCESCGRYFATTTSAEAESEPRPRKTSARPAAHLTNLAPMPKPHQLPAWTSKFLDMLRRVPNVAAACRAAKVVVQTAYERRESDPGFARAWDEAIQCAVDDLVGEAWRRASFGTERPVFYMGEQCGEVQEYSDGLLMFLLRAHRRGVYGDKSQVEVAGEGGGPLQAVIYLPSNGRDDTPPAGTPGDVAL